MIVFNFDNEGRPIISPLGLCGQCEKRIDSGNICKDCMSPEQHQAQEVYERVMNNPELKEALMNKIEQSLSVMKAMLEEMERNDEGLN